MNIKVNENKKETSHSPKGVGGSPGGTATFGTYPWIPRCHSHTWKCRLRNVAKHFLCTWAWRGLRKQLVHFGGTNERHLRWGRGTATLWSQTRVTLGKWPPLPRSWFCHPDKRDDDTSPRGWTGPTRVICPPITQHSARDMWALVLFLLDGTFMNRFNPTRKKKSHGLKTELKWCELLPWPHRRPRWCQSLWEGEMSAATAPAVVAAVTHVHNPGCHQNTSVEIRLDPSAPQGPSRTSRIQHTLPGPQTTCWVTKAASMDRNKNSSVHVK